MSIGKDIESDIISSKVEHKLWSYLNKNCFIKDRIFLNLIN